MSRKTLHKDHRLTVVGGEDHMLGGFYQIYDNQVTGDPSGEGIVLDWSEEFGYDSNMTGIPNTEDPMEIVAAYVLQYGKPIQPIIMN